MFPATTILENCYLIAFSDMEDIFMWEIVNPDFFFSQKLSIVSENTEETHASNENYEYIPKYSKSV